MRKIFTSLILGAFLVVMIAPIAEAGGMGQFNDRHVIGGHKGAKIYCGRGGCRPVGRR